MKEKVLYVPVQIDLQNKITSSKTVCTIQEHAINSGKRKNMICKFAHLFINSVWKNAQEPDNSVCHQG